MAISSPVSGCHLADLIKIHENFPLLDVGKVIRNICALFSVYLASQ